MDLIEKFESPYTGKPKVSEAARKILGFTDVKDKIICFIPEWERDKQNEIPANPPEVETYQANESSIFQTARYYLLEQGSHQFLAYRELGREERSPADRKRFYGSNPDFKELNDLFKRHLKDLIPDKRRRTIYELNERLRTLVDDHIRVSEDSPIDREFLENKTVEKFRLSVLCLDYKYFTQNLTYEFVRHCESPSKAPHVSEELLPLFDLFKRASMEIKMDTFWRIARIIRHAAKNELTPEDEDDMDYLSMNHVQNIKVPDFWNATKRRGYTCPTWNDPKNYLPCAGKADFRFFYSFESFLIFDLKNRLLKVRRCRNCKSIMPVGYMGKYCPPNAASYAVCRKERNRKRQQKHYSLTKS